MSIKTPLTKDRIRNHFTYSAWKYLLLVVCAVFVWSLVYTQTAYRSPQDKRIDVYVKSSTVTDEAMNAFFEPIWKEFVPDMELVQGTQLMASAADDYYSQMQMTVYMAAGDGDIYILPLNDFKSFAAAGSFVSLDELVDSGRLSIDGLDVTAGRVTVVDEDEGTAETHLYGIPADDLYGYMDGMQLDNRGMVLAILVNNQNDENVIPFFNALVQAGRASKPGWLEESAETPDPPDVAEENAAAQ